MALFEAPPNQHRGPSGPTFGHPGEPAVSPISAQETDTSTPGRRIMLVVVVGVWFLLQVLCGTVQDTALRKGASSTLEKKGEGKGHNMGERAAREKCIASPSLLVLTSRLSHTTVSFMEPLVWKHMVDMKLSKCNDFGLQGLV